MKALLLAMITMVCVVAACEVAAAPKAKFEKECIDFGQAATGTSVKAIFHLTNAGDASLDLTSVRAICECTRVQTTEREVAPGHSSVIEAVFDSTGFAGLVSKGVVVQTNDPNRPEIVLRITGQVIGFASLVPLRIDFGRIKANTAYTRTLEVIPVDSASFTITKVESQGSRVSVPKFTKARGKKGACWLLDVVVNTGSETGKLSEEIVISAKCGPDVTLSAQVSGNVVR